MICPNCGAPLPDTASMCYSCKARFNAYHAQPFDSGYQEATIKDFILPIILWILIIACLFFPFFTITNSITKEVYTGYYYQAKWAVLVAVICCAVYFLLFIGYKKLYKKILHLLISTILFIIHLMLNFLAMGVYNDSPGKEHQAFEYNDANRFLLLFIAILFFYDLMIVISKCIRKR